MTSFRELTAILDKYQAGDSVSVTVVRYANAYLQQTQANSYNDMFGNFFGGYGFGYGYGYGNGNDNYNNGNNGNFNSDSNQNTRGELAVGGGYEFITVDVTLELPEDDD